MEKLLLEACLEAMKTGAIVGIQDMGAAGLDVFDLRNGRPGGTGMEMDLQFVPQRETGHVALRNHAERIPGTHVAGR